MKLYISIAIAALLSGCATTYQAEGVTGGFSSSQLDENVFQIGFKGNGFTDRDKANNYALLRSAEIALEKGYSYFVIIDAQQYSKISTYTTPVLATTNINTNTDGSAYSSGNNINYSGHTYGTAKTTFSGGETQVTSKPRTMNTIVCFKEKPNGFSYNAEFVAKSMREKYGLNNQINK
jgi:hypothetical protein